MLIVTLKVRVISKALRAGRAGGERSGSLPSSGDEGRRLLRSAVDGRGEKQRRRRRIEIPFRSIRALRGFIAEASRSVGACVSPSPSSSLCRRRQTRWRLGLTRRWAPSMWLCLGRSVGRSAGPGLALSLASAAEADYAVAGGVKSAVADFNLCIIRREFPSRAVTR